MVAPVIVALVALAGSPSAPDPTEEPTVTVDESSVGTAPTQEPRPAEATQVPRTAASPTARAGEPPIAVAPAPPAPVRPALAIGLEISYAQGGGRFVTLISPVTGPGEGFDAGDGMSAAISGSWMPYARDRYSLGVYASAGVKYVAAQSDIASMSYTRYPLALAAQLLAPVSERWIVLGHAGPTTEVGAKLSGGGAIAGERTQFTTRLGGFVDVGVYRALGAHAGIGVLLRYTYLDISYAGGTNSANNLAVGLGAYLGL